MSLKFSTAEIMHDGTRMSGALAELENAVIALFWEGDQPRLGTLTATLPSSVSSPLLGDRDQFLGQVLGERLASVHGKMALVSINFSSPLDTDASRRLLDLVKMLSGKKAAR